MYDSESRRSKKGFSFAPILLIALGVIFLLNNFGILPWEIWQNIWKFWPIILILFGIEAILGRTSSLRTVLILLALIFLVPLVLVLNPLTGNPLANKTISVEKPLGNLSKAQLDLNFPSSSLEIKALDKNSNRAVLAEIKYSSLLPEPTVTEKRNFGEAKFEFSQPEKYLPLSSNVGNNVNLQLSRLIQNFIYIKANTGVFDLKLEDLNVPNLEIESGASQINISLNKTTNNKTFIKVSAAKISLTIPKELATQLKINSEIGEVKIDEKRFSKNGSVYTTNGFDSAIVKATIEIIGSASSIEVR